MKTLNEKKRFILASSLLIVTMAFRSFAGGDSAETSAEAKIKIKERIKIEKKSDLLFPNAYQGDASGAVAPSEAGAAVFEVKGEKGKTFAITYPDSSILMKTGAGDTANKQILVNGFVSDQPGESGTVDLTSGATLIKVGASRAAILDDQVVADDYTGTFRVRVNYLN